MTVRTRLLLAALAVPLLVALQNLPPGAPLPEPIGMVPVGTIIAWWGRYENIPPGYELCDGKPPTAQDATFKERKPDLRGQFLRGGDSPQAFNPRTYEVGGEDTVTVQLAELTLNVNQLPPHKHPMPHTHSLAPHTHALTQDLTLPASPNHTHSVTLGTHQHPLAAHSHPLGGTWTQVVLAAGSDPPASTDFVGEILVQDASGNAVSGVGQLGNSSKPFVSTDVASAGGATSLGGVGTVPTTGLRTGTGTKTGNPPAAFTDTGAVVGTAETGDNATTQQPIEPGTATIDNRPAYTSVLWIIRVK